MLFFKGRAIKNRSMFRVLAVTVLFFRAALSQSCDFQPSMNNHGTNMEQTSAGSAQDCCNYCSDAVGCVGFTWVSGNSDCYLKSSVDPATPDPAVTSGQVTGPPPPPGPCTIFPGENNGGHNLAESPAGDPDACCAACVSLAGCIGWTFVTEGAPQCFLKDKVAPLQPDPAVISGGRAGPSCALTPGVNSMGTIAVPPAPAADAGACCGACANANAFKCLGFTFVTASSLCFLKNSTGAPIPDAGVISGTPPSPCALQPGLNSMGNITNALRLEGPSACCSACMANGTSCAGFTFTPATSMCFLKSALGTSIPDANVVSGTPPRGQRRCRG